MIELTSPSRVVGRIFDGVHTADLKNGAIVGLDTINADGTYDIKVPATADLGTESYYMVNTGEYDYTGNELVSEFTNKAGKPMALFPLVADVEVKLPADMITGTATTGEYLIPSDGDTLLNAAADLTGGTKLALVVVDDATFLRTDGYREDAVLARVIQG